jgi:DNA polymerase III epsilon subunit-like protein
MRYVSIDIETTGLNPQECDIIQFAAVIDDLSVRSPIEELPRFNAYFYKDFYCGELKALSMHSLIFEKINEAKNKRITFDQSENEYYIKLEELPAYFRNFLTRNDVNEDYQTGAIALTVAGKNASSFDIPFLKEKIKDWDQIYFRQRVLDPAILYLDLGVDKEIPGIKKCMKRANINMNIKFHDALQDALAVVKLIRDKL